MADKRTEEQVQAEIASARAELRVGVADLHVALDELSKSMAKFKTILPVLGGAGAILGGVVKGRKSGSGTEILRLGPLSIRLRG